MKSFLFSFFFLIKETNIFCFALMSVVALAALVVFLLLLLLLLLMLMSSLLITIVQIYFPWCYF